MARPTGRALGDGHRISDGVLGADKLVARVRSGAERVASRLSRRGREHRAGPFGRPTLRQVIDAVMQLLSCEAIDLQERPRARRCAQFERLATSVWVHEYGGRQIELARALGLDSGVVSLYYGQAIALAGDFDEQAAAVVALLRGRKRATSRVVTDATHGAQPVRYHVDVRET